MWINRSCPKCRGNLFIENEVEGCYVKCLQCGLERQLNRKDPNNRKQIVANAKISILQTA